MGYSDRFSGHTDVVMDPALWGELQNHINLATIWVKLPLTPFFRMRKVCKEWNRLASNRDFLERTFTTPISYPFFAVTTPHSGDRLLTFQASSWSSMRIPTVKIEVSGLLYEFSWKNIYYRSIRIFDLHTRVFHTLPRIPSTMQRRDDNEYYDEPMVGMTVDTTLIPYSFRVILADEDFGTRIYDSNTGAWMQKPSTYDRALDGHPRSSCANDNRFMCINAAGDASMTFDLHTYDLQRDKWSFQVSHAFEAKQAVIEMGLWRERLFVIGMNFPVVTMWETDRYLQEPWILFDSMPRELVAWISSGKRRNCEYIQSKFYNEKVLLYNFIQGKNFTDKEKAVLYNLEHKTWEKIVVPTFLRPRPHF